MSTLGDNWDNFAGEIQSLVNGGFGLNSGWSRSVFYYCVRCVFCDSRGELLLCFVHVETLCAWGLNGGRNLTLTVFH